MFVCLSVCLFCLFVCKLAYRKKTHILILPNFLYMLAVARFSVILSLITYLPSSVAEGYRRTPFLLCIVTYRCFHGIAPSHISETVSLKYKVKSCRLPSGSMLTLLVPPSQCTIYSATQHCQRLSKCLRFVWRFNANLQRNCSKRLLWTIEID